MISFHYFFTAVSSFVFLSLSSQPLVNFLPVPTTILLFPPKPLVYFNSDFFFPFYDGIKFLLKFPPLENQKEMERKRKGVRAGVLVFSYLSEMTDLEVGDEQSTFQSRLP